MKIISKDQAIKQIADARPGSYIPFIWVCDRTILDGGEELSVVCSTLVRVKINYANTKYAKEALERKIAKVMADSECSREDAIKDIEATKRSTWFDHSDECQAIVYHRGDTKHSKPYIQVFGSLAKDISDFHKTKIARNRKVSVQYIVGLGTEDEVEILPSDLPGDVFKKMSDSLKKHINPGITWIKPLSDVIDIGFNK